MLRKYQQVAEEAVSLEAAVIALKESGASPVHAMGALRFGRGLALRDAKSAIVNSRAWYPEGDPLEQILREEEPFLDEDDANEVPDSPARHQQ